MVAYDLGPEGQVVRTQRGSPAQALDSKGPKFKSYAAFLSHESSSQEHGHLLAVSHSVNGVGGGMKDSPRGVVTRTETMQTKCQSRTVGA